MDYGRDYPLSLTAGVVFNLGAARGSIYKLRDVSVAGAVVYIQFNNSGAWIPLRDGDGGEGVVFDNVKVKCAVNVTANLYLGTVKQKSSNATVSVANVTATFEENNGGASPLDTIINAGFGAVISAARATKRSTIIYNPSTNTGPFRVGPGAAAGAGLKLEVGMSIEILGSMAISAFNEGAANEALTLTELDRI